MGFLRIGALALLAASPLGAPLDPFDWEQVSPGSQGFLPGRLESLRDDLASRKTTSLLIIRNDKIVLEWYGPGRDEKTPQGTASLAKALVGGLSLAVAQSEGLLSPDDPASKFIPEWAGDPGKRSITIRHLATHSSGLEDAEEGQRAHDELEGWKGDFWKRRAPPHDPFTLSRDRTPIVAPPGTEFHYSNPGMAMLSYAITSSLKEAPEKDLRSLLRERVMKPLGIKDPEWSVGYGETIRVEGLPLVADWGGASFTPRAVARIGRLMLHQGSWEGREILKARAAALAVAPAPSPSPEAERRRGNPFPASGLGWYTNSDSVWPEVPSDAFAGAGAGHQVLLVVPSLNLIVVRNGSALPGQFWEGLQKHLFRPVLEALQESSLSARYPVPPSPVLAGLAWSPLAEVVRQAPDGDTWPTTWADDDDLYTAYGDGTGFEPKVEVKLSLGFAKVKGTGGGFTGSNIRSPSGEDRGDGRAGKKVSSLLMVENVLYAWVRNANRKGGACQLAWSTDHAESWTSCDWKFEEFGYVTFVNFGKNYSGARDGYVYVYSHDDPSAYRAADRMILARVPQDRIRDRSAYEFFRALDPGGHPLWTAELRERGAAFTHPGRCLRSGITYDAGVHRYLWWQQVPNRKNPADTRFEGGFGIYDAPEPWGPWTTVYFTERWDTGPGETGHFPTKWMSEDGKTLYLVFSGGDNFSVRKAVLRVNSR